MKRLKTILVAATLVYGLAALGGCGGIDDPSNDTKGIYETGDHLTVAIVGSLNGIVDANDGTTTQPSFTDVLTSFQLRNDPPPGADEGSDLYISEYTIVYTSSDGSAVPLPSVTVPVGEWVSSKGTLTLTDWPYMLASTKAVFYYGAGGAQVVYTANITFHATNMFGYDTDTKIGWVLIIAEYI
jgi:hypothetical protein